MDGEPTQEQLDNAERRRELVEHLYSLADGIGRELGIEDDES